MQGYFVWAKLIEALADLGYDANNIVRILVFLMIRKRSGFCLQHGVDDSTSDLT